MLGDTMSSLFQVSKNDQENLSNIATGMVLYADIADRVLNCKTRSGKTTTGMHWIANYWWGNRFILNITLK